MNSFEETNAIVDEINRCLANHKLAYKPTFDINDINVSEKIITNHQATPKLTNLILHNYFPQNPINEYHHFTDLTAFNSILNHKKLWLFSVMKRFKENEFKPFYLAHRMDGYEYRKNSDGIPLENELVKDAFYISFTGDSLSTDAEANMWEYFAKVTGVRLVFEVKNVITDLRQIFYSKSRSDLPVLTDLINIAGGRNKYLILERIATIGFFYLPGIYETEQEVRLLVKREAGVLFGMRFGKMGDHEYMEFPFNISNPLAEFKLKKIIFDTNTDIKKAEKIIRLTGFSGIPTERNNR